jgi:hypothetical protein
MQPTTSDRIAILVALVLPTAVTWLYFVALDGAPAALQQTAYGVGKAIQFGLPIVWVALVQRRRLDILVFSRSGHGLGLHFGLVVGVAIAGLYALVLKPLGAFDEPAEAVRGKVASFGVHSPAAFILLAVFYSLLHSLLEEYYWRWFVFGQLDRWLPLPGAIAVSSLAFAAHHVLVLAHYFSWSSPLTWLFAGCIAVGGAVWAWLYRRSGSLLAPWLSHALVDAAIFAVGYDLIRA